MTGAAPAVLLAWMRKRDGVVTGRDISDSSPRPFRRRPAVDIALTALLGAGLVEEVSSRPKTFRVTDKRPQAEDIRARLDAEIESRRHLPAEAAAYIAAVDLRASLMRNLGCRCTNCDDIGQRVDDAVMATLGCIS